MNYDDRYAPNWPETSRLTRTICPNCILCGQPAEESHHVAYRDRQGLVAGREIPGVHVFPLCHTCHMGEGGAHSTTNWHHESNAERDNHQSPAYYRKLRAAWVAAVHQS